MSITAPLYAYASPLGEFKAAAIILAKAFGWVLVSIIIITIGLLLFIKITKKKSSSTNSNIQNTKCEIDNTSNIDEAINTFLNINSK